MFSVGNRPVRSTSAALAANSSASSPASPTQSTAQPSPRASGGRRSTRNVRIPSSIAPVASPMMPKSM